MGLISLCGIVVRNGIILVDYCNERIAEGASLEQAAREAGARRLRPIFLTSMAAAVGGGTHDPLRVKPLEPAGECHAFGLIFSMFSRCWSFPSCSWRSNPAPSRMYPQAGAAVTVAIHACVLLAGGKEASAEPVRQSLTLPQAVELALKQNSVLKIAREKVTESDQKIVSARAQYFPHLSNNTKYMALSRQTTRDHSGGEPGKYRRRALSRTTM